MKTKHLILICIISLFSVNLVYGRWPGVDPLAEKYYPHSPYNYAGNNPIRNIDPDGRDWYRHDETGAVFWQQGDAASITRDDLVFSNIGTTYDYTFESTIMQFTQSSLTSITDVGIGAENWVSQIANGINCYQASEQMLGNVGVQTAGRANEMLIVDAGANGRAGTGNANFNTGLGAINGALDNGNPIIVGVDYRNGSPNADGMTDHFVVVSSRTQTINNGQITGTTYNFFDPRTSHQAYGTSANNTFGVNNSQITGSYNHGGSNYNYVVVTVRRNR